MGVLDEQSRDDVFEPAQCGGFLLNGGRLYIDSVGSHLEYATAESIQLTDLIANDRAGRRMIVRALKDMGLNDAVRIYNNSVDHFGGHTFGCHENYHSRIDEEFFAHRAQRMYGFLMTRQIFAGVGRVGGHILGAGGLRPSYQDMVENPVDYIWVSHVYSVAPDPSVPFQLSQRADHILKTVASRVRFNRAVINPRWEHFYSSNGMTRLHLLFGEANQNEYAYALKVGTTMLVIRLAEDDAIPERWTLKHPILALRQVSRDQSFRWNVVLEDGTTIGAIELQRQYLALAQRFKGESDQTDWILREWESTLDGLESDPMAMGDRIDWVAKRRIVERYMEDANVGWDDDSLHSVDLEYHNIDPEQSLFFALQDAGEARRMVDDLDIVDATTQPPSDTRAFGRSRLIESVMNQPSTRSYVFDWSGASIERKGYFDLSDPYDSYRDIA